MHKYEEMEYSQIAKVLSCSESAVKSLLFRAYETLRMRLAHMACALERDLREAQLVARYELPCDLQRSAYDGGDHRVPASGLVVGHEQDRLACARHLDGAGRQPERQQLVA